MISQLYNQIWLCRYPQPKQVCFDKGSKFKKYCISQLKEFVIKTKPASIKTLQSNVIVERVHKVFGDVVRTHDLKQYTFDDVDPCGPVLN